MMIKLELIQGTNAPYLKTEFDDRPANLVLFEYPKDVRECDKIWFASFPIWDYDYAKHKDIIEYIDHLIAVLKEAKKKGIN